MKLIKIATIFLGLGMLLPSQQLKLQQLDHSPIHPLMFTLVHGAIYPDTVTIEKNTIYNICVRNGMFTQDVNFDVSAKGKPVVPGDSVSIKRVRSANAYGFFRFTPGTYTLAVREYPQYTATIEVK